jgi:hypothetical protein
MTVWPWLALVGLGAFHGVNPAMGWLFAVALGLHRQRRAVVLTALLPIALGHALAVGLVVVAVVSLGRVLDPHALGIVAGVVLVGWALHHWRGRGRHRVRVGMRAGMVGLTAWSFLMASAHGAGLMLVPALLPLERAVAPAHAGHGIPVASLVVAFAAVGVHTLAMLAVTAVVALVVYDWVGVGFLRRGWVNLDLVWTIALAATGLILLASAGLSGGGPRHGSPHPPALLDRS